MLPCVAVLAATLALGPGTAGAAGTPKDDPAKGLRYGGLERAATGQCDGGFEHRADARAGGPPLCTHGPDPAPAGVDVRVPRQPEPPAGTLRPRAAVAAEGPACAGDGSSGRRVQLVYANIAGRPDRSEATTAST